MNSYKIGLIGFFVLVGVGIWALVAKLTGPIDNPIPFPPTCTLQTVGFDTPCPSDHKGLREFFKSNFGVRYGDDWGKLLYQAAISDTCPETCKKSTCECTLNEQAFAAEYAQFTQAATEERQKENDPTQNSSISSITNMMSKLMLYGGVVNVLGWLIAIPIAIKSAPWIKVTGITITLGLVIVIQISSAWGIFSIAFWSETAVVKLFWQGFGLFFANPLISLFAFGIGVLAIELATQSKEVSWTVGIGAGILVFLAGAIGVFPQWINTTIIVKSGIDQWVAMQALFAGYIFAPGLVSITLGPIWTLVGAIPSMYKGDEAMTKLGLG